MATLRELIQEEGFLGLWNGLIPNLLLVSNPAIQFMVYEYLKAVVEGAERRKNEKAENCVGLTPIQTLVLGAFAKSVATVATYPYITIKSRLQVRPDTSGDQSKVYKSTSDAIIKIMRFEGFAGFFKGLSSKIVQSVLTAALLFLFQAQIANFILRLAGVDCNKNS